MCRRKPSLVANVSMNSIQNLLVKSGAVKTFKVDAPIIDIVDAGKVVSVMKEKAINNGFPYMFYRG